jgi:hypothetical protein
MPSSGGYTFLFISYSSFLVCVSGRCGLLFTGSQTHSAPDGHTGRTIVHAYLKRRLKFGVAYEKESVTPWRWHLEAETCRCNLLSTIKKLLTAPLSICWTSFTWLKNARYNSQYHLLLVLYYWGGGGGGGGRRRDRVEIGFQYHVDRVSNIYTLNVP